jgi:oligosaccharide amylase
VKEMQNKYLNDAIIGNKKIVASYTKKGELLRLYYPAPDNRQFIDYCYAGLKINDSGLVNLYNDINNEYKQYYTEDTNVLNTQIYNTYFNLKINQLDFVPIKENILIKRYEFVNEGNIDLDIKFLQHSKLISNENDDVSCKVINQGMIQYSHDFALSTISKKTPLLSFQINDTNANIHTGTIQDKDYIGMSSDSSISYDIGIIKPHEKKELCLYIWVNENKEKYKLDEIEHKNDEIKKIDIEKELQNTIKYWKKYTKEHSTLELKENTEYDRKIKRIYNRTVLLYPLLINDETGGISASIEIDEHRSKSGRYSYCWPRDAVFITKAFDILGMEKETEKFYKSFCKATQSKSGMWEQRFYTDGRLAPCWGYQIDETASVIYGLYNHYEKTKNIKFIRDNFKMLEKASKFLQKYVEDVTLEENKIHVSYDLWEMHEGIHLYSMASIFAAFTAMLKMYEIIEQEKENKENKEQAKNRLKQEEITEQKEILTKALVKIKDYVLKNFYNEDKKCFRRNNTDEKMDISMLGCVTPFNMFSPKEKKIVNTVEKINLTLRTYTGGYRRFEDDNYMNGNPWPIATLWMALYYEEIKDYKKAKECLDFVVASSTQHGFLAEQVDNNTMESNWVIGLGWSHAMFIIVLEKMLNRKN